MWISVAYKEMCLDTDQLEKRRKDPLGHSPDDDFVDDIRGERVLDAAHRQREVAPHAALRQAIERQPEHPRGLDARDEGRARRERAHKAAHHTGGERWRAWVEHRA